MNEWPSNQPTRQLTNQSINQSIHSIIQSINQSTNQLINQPTNQPVNQSINKLQNVPLGRRITPRPQVVLIVKRDITVRTLPMRTLHVHSARREPVQPAGLPTAVHSVVGTCIIRCPYLHLHHVTKLLVLLGSIGSKSTKTNFDEMGQFLDKTLQPQSSDSDSDSDSAINNFFI